VYLYNGNVGIAIPDQFFQVLITKDEQDEYITAGFLFPHVKERSDLPYTELIDYLVPVDSIETVSGLDFFQQLADPKENDIESKTNIDFWKLKGFD